MYDEYRPEYDVHRYRHHGYRPSQSYPPSYVDERDYRNSPSPEAVMNPEYLEQLDYYWRTINYFSNFLYNKDDDV